MAHVGQEFGFGLGRLIGQLLGPDQFEIGLDQFGGPFFHPFFKLVPGLFEFLGRFFVLGDVPADAPESGGFSVFVPDKGHGNGKHAHGPVFADQFEIVDLDGFSRGVDGVEGFVEFFCGFFRGVGFVVNPLQFGFGVAGDLAHRLVEEQQTAVQADFEKPFLDVVENFPVGVAVLMENAFGFFPFADLVGKLAAGLLELVGPFEDDFFQVVSVTGQFLFVFFVLGDVGEKAEGGGVSSPEDVGGMKFNPAELLVLAHDPERCHRFGVRWLFRVDVGRTDGFAVIRMDQVGQRS